MTLSDIEGRNSNNQRDNKNTLNLSVKHKNAKEAERNLFNESPAAQKIVIPKTSKPAQKLKVISLDKHAPNKKLAIG